MGKKNDIELGTYSDWSQDKINQFNVDVNNMSKQLFIDKCLPDYEPRTNEPQSAPFLLITCKKNSGEWYI